MFLISSSLSLPINQAGIEATLMSCSCHEDYMTELYAKPVENHLDDQKASLGISEGSEEECDDANDEQEEAGMVTTYRLSAMFSVPFSEVCIVQ